LAAWWLIARSGPAAPQWWVVGAVLAALTVPRLVADAWHEFVHEPRFGGSPVAPGAFAVTSVGRLEIEGGVLTTGFSLLQDVSVGSIIGVGCVAAAVPLMSGLIGPRVVLLLHRVVDVASDHEAHGHVAALTAAHRLPTPRLVELDKAAFQGTNAYVTGQRSDLTVAVSSRLLSGPDALLRHVVGHEITHLRHRHLLWSALASSISLGLTVSGALVITMGVAEGNERLPVLVILAALLSQPFRLLLAWLSRANERQADRAAMRHAPVSPELIKQLHLSDRPLLEPSRLARWHSSHPAPAERLEAAARSSRGALSGAGFATGDEQGSIDS